NSRIDRELQHHIPVILQKVTKSSRRIALFLRADGKIEKDKHPQDSDLTGFHGENAGSSRRSGVPASIARTSAAAALSVASSKVILSLSSMAERNNTPAISRRSSTVRSPPAVFPSSDLSHASKSTKGRKGSTMSSAR